MFPRPVAPAVQRCARCHKPTKVANLVEGFGSDCAALLGLTVPTPRLHVHEQTGMSLLDLLEDEPEDQCDGWDR
jgi:hypothetical protein